MLGGIEEEGSGHNLQFRCSVYSLGRFSSLASHIWTGRCSASSCLAPGSREHQAGPLHASQGRVAGAELQAMEESRRKSFWTRLSLLPLPSKGGFFSGQAAWSVGEGPPASGLGSELRIMWQRLLTFFADVGNLKEPWSFSPKEIELADSHASLQGMATIFTQYRF